MSQNHNQTTLKTLKFAPHLVPLILEGSKTTTWRLFDEKNLKTGDQVELLESGSERLLAKAELIKVYEKPLGKLQPEDYAGHEKFSSDREMYANYAKMYDREVGPDTKVKIIRFKIVS